jgi:hypothetical protein
VVVLRWVVLRLTCATIQAARVPIASKVERGFTTQARKRSFVTGNTLERDTSMTKELKKLGWWSAVLALAFSTVLLPRPAAAQDQNNDQQDDPPTRVARLGYIEGSVSFQPAGEDDWVQAVPNRPMTTGDKLWADKDSRAELQLGSAVIRLSENTGVSFLNLDDNTVQLQLSSGAINIRVRRLDQDDDFEIDTPNLAFTVSQPGLYRLNASEDGTSTIVALRDGGGQATGNGQTYTLHAGQQGTFSGTDSLNADVEDIVGPDPFDNWAYARDRSYDQSPSARYLAPNVVGYEDLDANGDWRNDPSYGNVWYPHVAYGWAPYHTGHWDWIAPWGYTWVDDAPWGYAPFHYGRWVFVGERWGWIAGPPTVRAVYAPALVVFIGGGPGGWGGNVGWFPLGPREVYVPPYYVSRGYMTQVNVSNTTVNTTIVTNVYNTTIINKSTTITNVTYANRSVQGAVVVVPQRAFASAQPVARAAVTVNAQQLASAPISARGAAVVPTQQAVLGARASSAGHVSAPPAAVMNRQVIAKKTPPPPPVPFAKQQQALAAHPGQPVASHEMQSLRPAGAAASRPMVKVAPPGKPATATMERPASQPNAGRPAQPPANQQANRPPQPAQNQPANRPAAPAEQSRPLPAQPNRPPAEQNRPAATAKPSEPPAHSQPNRPSEPPAQPNRPESNRPEPKPTQTAPKPATPPAVERQPEHATVPAQAKPAAPPKKTPEQKKQEDEKKKQEKPPGA